MMMIIIIIIDAICHGSTPGIYADPVHFLCWPHLFMANFKRVNKVLPTFECRAASSCLQVKKREHLARVP